MPGGPLFFALVAVGLAIALMRSADVRRRGLIAAGISVCAVIVGLLSPWRTGMFDFVGLIVTLGGCIGWPAFAFVLFLTREPRDRTGFYLAAGLVVLGWLPGPVGGFVSSRCNQANFAHAQSHLDALDTVSPDRCAALGALSGTPAYGGYQLVDCKGRQVLAFPGPGDDFLARFDATTGESLGTASMFDGVCAYLDR
ncbi:MAG: hypothetical protein KC656_04130 [Myxococcales bacterium]|nr:hypothetical protein [Myxococcales bacterium]MCB9669832.1 hypothetical protein [Alphaproteobacteria bacterium]MCB9694568.1 hypothetical protein [Alphaproteobacteria bacterium]